MSKYDNLLRILLAYETILELTLEKGKHIMDFHERTSTYFLDKTSNKLWNDKIIDIIETLDDDFRNNINTYDTRYLLDIRSLKEIYNDNYSRIDSYDRKILIYSESLHPDYYYYHKIDENMRLYVKESLSQVKKIIKKIIDHNENEEKELDYALKNNFFEDDITLIINKIYKEILTGYHNKCYLSAISLCGKITETALFGLLRKYDPTYSEKKYKKLGLQQRIELLEKFGYDFSGVEKYMDVIGLHRNMAVHGNIVEPTVDDARGIISLTKNTLIKVTSRDCK